MTERHVICGGVLEGRKRPDSLYLNVDPSAKPAERINLQIEDISKKLAEGVPDVFVDLLEIATYVFCADQFTGRGSSLMAHMGSRWRRRFKFQIPVRQPSIWRQQAVNETLCQTLGFLSEDEFEFEFLHASRAVPLQSYLGFSDAQAMTSPDEVVLFSGGLDSLGGTVDALLRDRKNVVLVSHKSAQLVASKQNSLVVALRKRSRSGKSFHVPVKVNSGRREAVEFTQRTRSFLFAALGFILARMFGRNDLSFYENGIVSLNLPVAEHVLGARASRTTHPRVIADYTKLFSLLANSAFQVQNPYLWKTKTQVVRSLVDNGAADLIRDTVSCARVRELTKNSKHCGVCSQCVDRRIGVLGAEARDHEPQDFYSIDLFEGQIEPGPALTMIESYMLRAHRLATMSELTFSATYGQIFRVLPYLPGDPDVNARKVWDLHRRHGQEAVWVIDSELRRTASLSQALSRGKNSLLSLIVSAPLDYSDPVEAEPTPTEQAATDTHDYKPERIQFAVAIDRRNIVFKNGIELGGVIFELFSELLKEFEGDLDAGTFRDQYRFVKADKLAKRVGMTEESLRRGIMRSRRKIEQAFLLRLGRTIDANDVIENQEWSGYRLNPNLLLVKPVQLRDETALTSRIEKRRVTSSLTGH